MGSDGYDDDNIQLIMLVLFAPHVLRETFDTTHNIFTGINDCCCVCDGKVV